MNLMLITYGGLASSETGRDPLESTRGMFEMVSSFYR